MENISGAHIRTDIRPGDLGNIINLHGYFFHKECGFGDTFEPYVAVSLAEYIRDKKERERLNRLVNEITDEELNLVIYKEGWTIAVVLAHLAFYDERRRVLLRKWRKKGVTPSPHDEYVINNTLLPFLLAISLRDAANLSVFTAEALDRELEEASDELIAGVKALGDRYALNRAIHRKMHLDEIEAFLEAKRGEEK